MVLFSFTTRRHLSTQLQAKLQRLQKITQKSALWYRPWQLILPNKCLGTSPFSRFSQWATLVRAIGTLLSFVQSHRQKAPEYHL